MRKIITAIIIGVILVLAGVGYYWWQKRQAGQPSFQPQETNISCDSLKNIPSAQYAPENVRVRFSECFPERK